MGKLSRVTAVAAVICILLLLPAESCSRDAVAENTIMADARTDALKTVGDLRASLEARAQAAPLRRLSQTMKSVGSARELNGYGMTLFLARMPANALIVLTEAARRSPDDFLPFNNLGAILNNLGQYEKALILLRYADRLSPNNAMVLSNLGVAELGRRREKEAEALFLRAIARAPNHPEANYALGALSARRGDAQAAQQYLNSSLEGAFTPKAARALKSLEKESRRAAGKQRSTKRDRPSAQPPPVPQQASKENEKLRLVLPMIEAESLPEFVGAQKTYQAEADAAYAIGKPLVLGLRDLANPLNQVPAEAAVQKGRIVIALADGKAKRGFENASLWYSALEDLNNEYATHVTGMMKKLTAIGAEHHQIYETELKKCLPLRGRARDACEAEAKRRACGRYFEAFEPLFQEFKKAYESFVPRWQTAAEGYIRTADYWASFYADPLEAKGRRLDARVESARQYAGIVAYLDGMSNAFGPPLSVCFQMPKPPPPTGELRLEDFVVPCSFSGIDLSFDGVAVGIDCTSVTIGGELGPLVGELEWNFVEKTGTLFIGVGGEITAGKLISVGASAKLGLVLSFDRENFTDIGLKGEAEMGASLAVPGHAIDIAKAGRNEQIGLNSAPSISRTLPSFLE
ncbi:MAG: hypothetical protein JXA73_15195 [Acidobacteria bacterium]|nr:hypothetical protein [Acidobacteriota bacterium]